MFVHGLTVSFSYRDCGVFVAAYAESFACGLLAPPVDFDIHMYRMKLATLLWQYATQKQAEGAISAPEVTGVHFRKKGGPKRGEVHC